MHISFRSGSAADCEELEDAGEEMEIDYNSIISSHVRDIASLLNLELLPDEGPHGRSIGYELTYFSLISTISADLLKRISKRLSSHLQPQNASNCDINLHDFPLGFETGGDYKLINSICHDYLARLETVSTHTFRCCVK